MDELKFLNPRKIEIEAQKLDGTMAHLECAKITADMVHSIGKAAQGADKNTDRALCEQMAVFFGGKHEDYRTFDMRIITQIIQWMTEQMRNPT